MEVKELKPVFSVSELNLYVSLMLSGDENMRDVRVNGEISGFKRHISGHLYFTLKDDKAAVRCVMFKPNALRLNFFPKDGMQVQVSGSATLYERDGSFQINVRSMEKTGDGQLFAKFLVYKQELEEKGWFDPELKKPIPFLPRAVGVVTSKTGAVLQDIHNVLSRRFPLMPIVLYPCSVQGEKAAGEIAAAIKRADEEKKCDVLIVGRGGGSIEDLWCFNEPEVAEAIHNCTLPVISAVGHETDFTIADFVADLRAPTPSAAAELAVPEWEGLKQRLLEDGERLERSLNRGLEMKRQKLEYLMSRGGRYRMENQLMQAHQRLDADRETLLHLGEKSMLLHRQELESLRFRLEGLSPTKAMERGFAVISDEEGNLYTSFKPVKVGTNVKINWEDGWARATVFNKSKVRKKDRDNGDQEL